MFRAVFIQTSKRISETLIGIGLFIVSESIFILSVHKLGVGITIFFFSLVYSTIGLFLFFWFQREATSSSPIGRLTRWTIRRATILKTKYARLIATSQLLAVLVMAVLAGAFVTTIFIGLLGYRGRQAKLFVVLQTIFSVTAWALFYAGSLRLVLGPK